jgi:hypothetical protein
MQQFFSDWWYLSVRSIRQIWRPWLALIPSLFMPVFFFAVNATALQAFSQVPGFPRCFLQRLHRAGRHLHGDLLFGRQRRN